ncbi:MAG TPA: hypothetical protein VFQ60_01005 [Patescibacteria group bacterium]|nr:hypothetical protein [Patescibacteria group bacterium]
MAGWKAYFFGPRERKYPVSNDGSPYRKGTVTQTMPSRWESAKRPVMFCVVLACACLGSRWAYHYDQLYVPFRNKVWELNEQKRLEAVQAEERARVRKEARVRVWNELLKHFDELNTATSHPVFRDVVDSYQSSVEGIASLQHMCAQHSEQWFTERLERLRQLSRELETVKAQPHSYADQEALIGKIKRIREENSIQCYYFEDTQ